MIHATAAPSQSLTASLVGGLSGLEFTPGSNRSDDLSTADWRFLLPRLRFGTVLFLGVPIPSTVAALAASAHRVIVMADDPLLLRDVSDGARMRGVGNVETLCAQSRLPLQFADGAVDLLVPWGRRMTARLIEDAAFAEEAARVLSPDGVIYMEAHARRDHAHLRSWRRRLSASGLGAQETYWLLPRSPEGIRLATPLGEHASVQHAFDHVLHGSSRRARLLRQAGRAAARTGLYSWLLADRAMVIRRTPSNGAPSDEANGPSRYLASLGRDAGVPLERMRPAFFARGAYDSNKVAFFLFEDGRVAPTMLVKMTRSARYNHRLEAEFLALTRVKERSLAPDGTYPEALFLSRHDNLAVLAQRVVHGDPFRTRTRGDHDCPLARAAIAWIHELGVRSAEYSEAENALSGTLSALMERFEALYALTDAEQRFLRERLASVTTNERRIPTVFQHGDAGTWNVLVTRDDRVAFLDWEIGTTRGIPLWDLLDFLRSFGSWSARVRGQTDMTRAYVEHFGAPSPLARVQAEAVRTYCNEVGLPRTSIEGLFFSCWMQRAVREAAWTSRPLDEGTYVNLVRACIRHRDAEGFRWLFD